MELSLKRRSALYEAIHDPVVRARVALQVFHGCNSDVDARVARVTEEVFRRVLAVLNVEAK